MAITWLHLSDLHACRRDAWDSAQITETLVKDLEKLRRERDLVPDLIFFTGDAAWGHLGSMPIAEQFEQAFAFLENVRQLYGDHVPPENVFVVPGNHDVDRGRATKLAKAFLATADFHAVTELMRDAGEDWRGVVQRLDPYRDFVVNHFPYLLPDDEARKRLIAGHTREVGGKKVGIALFNTAWSCSGDKEKGGLWLAGDLQRGFLRPFVKDAEIKIALLHHPPNWFGAAEDPKFGRKLQEDFHFALHGHEHTDWVGVDDRGKVRVGAGACYARRDCGENVGYALTRLVPEEARVEVHLRSWGDESGWVARLKSEDTDDRGVRHAELKWLAGSPSAARPVTAPTTRASRSKKEVPKPRDPQVLAYLERLRRRSEHLPLIGFGKRGVQIPIALDEVYIALEADLHRAGLAEERGRRAEAMGESGARQPIAFDQALDFAKREFGLKALIVLGDPGTGKTTLLKHFVLAALAEGAAGRLGLPVLLELRALRHRAEGLRLALAEALLPPDLSKASPDFEATWQKSTALAGHLLDHERLLILVDGLDEIAAADERFKVARWLDRAAEELGHVLVVTSRFQGYRGDIRLSGHFLELQIRRLDPESAGSFIAAWYSAVERGLHGASERAAAERMAAAKAESLKERLFDPNEPRAARIRDLVRNPLLLQIVCLVHRAQKDLPERRAELFGACIDILLESWIEGKDLPLSFQRDAALKLLRPLAWDLQTAGEKRIARNDLLVKLEPLAASESLSRHHLEILIQAVVDQSGLLSESEDGFFEFLHDSFREYLAARHVQWKFSEDPAKLEALAATFAEVKPEDSWREVILLSVGLDGMPLLTPLLRRVLAGRALHRNSSLAHDLVKDTIDRSAVALLEFLIDPNRDAAESLAALSLLKALETGWQGRRIGEKTGLEIVAALEGAEDTEVRLGAAALLGRESNLVVVSDRPELGQERTHEPDGSRLVWVPPGFYSLGDERQWSGDPETPYSWEGPEHQVFLEGFWIGKFPVTCAQYRRFLDATGHRVPELWDDARFTGAEQPVVGVDWQDAQAFCRWSGLDLPSEAQWEAAARGVDKRRFPWGDEPDPSERHANFDGSVGRTSPVGAYPAGAGPFGTHDQAGNVWEWCRDVFSFEAYRGRVVDKWSGLSTNVNGQRPVVDKSVDLSTADRVVRGGSWAFGAGYLRAAYRDWDRPSLRSLNLGFRVVLVSAPEHV